METIQWRSLCFGAGFNGFNKSSRKLCQKNKSSMVIYIMRMSLFLGFNPLKESHFQSKTRLDSRDHRGICSHTKGLRKCCRVCIAVFWEEEKTVEGEDDTQSLIYQRLPNLVANGKQNWILMHITMFISVRLPKKALGMSKGVQMAPTKMPWVKMSSVSSTYMFFEVWLDFGERPSSSCFTNSHLFVNNLKTQPKRNDFWMV